KFIDLKVNFQVRIYNETSLVDQQVINEPINWIKYGQLGREQGALIIGTMSGGLIVKLFRRTATLEEKIGEIGPVQAQFRKLNIPRRTQIYVDQTIRERKHAQLMHQVFSIVNFTQIKMKIIYRKDHKCITN
ncbi:unnamed protein product, partial [Brugia timori]|uniref:SAC domain-containing protein n=1 Tax=Brugia timori TaxID=42155 RepID=A0A0R3RD70_9BILA